MPQLIAEIARALLNPVSLCVSIFVQLVFQTSESAALLTSFRDSSICPTIPVLLVRFVKVRDVLGLLGVLIIVRFLVY